MKIESIKLIVGIIFLSFGVLGALIFFLEGFGILDQFFQYKKLSAIFRPGWTFDTGGGASNTPVFLGLCSIAGAILLNSIKTNSSKI
jgi:hypothetical protein